MYLNKNWYKLTIKPEIVSKIKDTKEKLDVEILNKYCINPIFNIINLREDPKIDFVGGGRGLNELILRFVLFIFLIFFFLILKIKDVILIVN